MTKVRIERGAGAWKQLPADLALVVRCRGQRLLAVGPGDPARLWYLAKTGVLLDTELAGARIGRNPLLPDDLGLDFASFQTVQCRAHGEHDVLAARLGEIVAARPAGARTTNVDVEQVAGHPRRDWQEWLSKKFGPTS